MSISNGADPAVELSVEDENRRNSETDDMQNILGSFMQAREETLEEMVGGFVYLTMDDVRQVARNAARVLIPNANLVFREGGEEPQIVPATTKTYGTSSSLPPTPGKPGAVEGGTAAKGGDQGQSDDIEEEVLEDSTSGRHSCEDALLRQRPASLTKFDNFVVCEDDDPETDDNSEEKDKKMREEKKEEEEGDEAENDEEDWLPTAGYMASFASAGTSEPEDKPHSPKTSPDSNQTPSIHQAHHNTGSSGTPSVLQPNISSQPSSSTSTKEASKSSTQKQSEEESVIARKQPDDCDAGSSVCGEDEDLEAPPAWALNPGEAEEEVEEAPVKRRVSVIGISTTVAATGASTVGEEASDAESAASAAGCSEEKTGSRNGGEDCSDEVVPFALDEDYDYDNVPYTPKFTAAEMNYLTSFLPRHSS